MKVKVTESDLITPSLNNQTVELKKILPKAYQFFKNATPKATGNARRNTVQAGNEIRANYPYAQPLDKGHSNQAPKGMTQPTIDYVKKLVDEITRKK